MLEAIRDDRPPLISGQEGAKALEIVLAIYKSYLTNQSVRLPLEQFASTDMTGIFK